MTRRFGGLVIVTRHTIRGVGAVAVGLAGCSGDVSHHISATDGEEIRSHSEGNYMYLKVIIDPLPIMSTRQTPVK